MSIQTVTITKHTFDEFGFDLPFNPQKIGTWTVSFNDNLTEMTPAHTKTITLGICELLVGCAFTGIEMSNFDTIELPSKFGCRGGVADFEVAPNKKLINVTGYLTAGFN